MGGGGWNSWSFEQVGSKSHIRVQPQEMKRAFSPWVLKETFSYGVAIGWCEAGPLALDFNASHVLHDIAHQMLQDGQANHFEQKDGERTDEENQQALFQPVPKGERFRFGALGHHFVDRFTVHGATTYLLFLRRVN